MQKRWWLVLGVVAALIVATGTVLAVDPTQKAYTFNAIQPDGGDGVVIIADIWQEVDADWLVFGAGVDVLSFGTGDAFIIFRQSFLDADTEMISFDESDPSDNSDDSLTFRADTVFLTSNGLGDVIITLGN